MQPGPNLRSLVSNSLRPLNEEDPSFKTVASSEIHTARPLSNISLVCTTSESTAADISGRVAVTGNLTTEDGAYLTNLSQLLKKSCDILKQYEQAATNTARADLAQQIEQCRKKLSRRS